ncbi:MAG: cytochrome c-type biogenesis protein CcmH [Alphaproteobacteria bacterium]|nr:cytochrome c-type biogenesis protein CcmH [Alphaproteobacteria bacterium]
MMRARCLALVLVLLAAGARAETVLPDPASEARAVELHKSLRCLVCQNQSIHDSNADLAVDLRQIVRERVAAGESDAGVVDYVVRRYGDFVLLRPPVKASTYLLWFGPALILLAGATAAFRFLRRARAAGLGAPAPLSDQERRTLAALRDGREP